MNYAIFCYREDHQCLGLCLEQIRSIDRAAQFYLFDDAAKPLFPAQVPAGNDISYKITYFARRGNLNGLECVRGMLGCMLDIPGDDPVIKIDADTLLMDPAEIIRSLKDRGKVAGGMQCSVPLAWAGCCYWLTRPAIKAALELLARREWPENARQEYPEDETISKILLYLYGASGVDVLEFRGGRRLIGLRTCDPRDLEEIARLARGGVCAVHCGQMAFYGPLAEREGISIRDACARIMEAISHSRNNKHSLSANLPRTSR